MKIAAPFAALAVAAISPPAAAEVVAAAEHGFSVRHEVQIAAPADAVYAALVTPSEWWSGAHSYSGEAANFSLEPRPGGCFCERLADGGAVEHLRVVFVQPGRMVRLRGGLGPLQPLGVAGAMTWALEPDEGGVRVRFAYAVGGFAEGGLDGWAAAVDGVVGEQLARLARRVETGAAD